MIRRFLFDMLIGEAECAGCTCELADERVAISDDDDEDFVQRVHCLDCAERELSAWDGDDGPPTQPSPLDLSRPGQVAQ